MQIIISDNTRELWNHIKKEYELHDGWVKLVRMNTNPVSYQVYLEYVDVGENMFSWICLKYPEIIDETNRIRLY